MCVRLMQNRMQLFSTAAKLCMTFKTKSANSTVTPLLTLGGQNVKSANIWGIYIGY